MFIKRWFVGHPSNGRRSGHCLVRVSLCRRWRGSTRSVALRSSPTGRPGSPRGWCHGPKKRIQISTPPRHPRGGTAMNCYMPDSLRENFGKIFNDKWIMHRAGMAGPCVPPESSVPTGAPAITACHCCWLLAWQSTLLPLSSSPCSPRLLHRAFAQSQGSDQLIPKEDVDARGVSPRHESGVP